MNELQKYVIFVNRESITHFKEVIAKNIGKAPIIQLYEGRFISSYTAILSEDELLMLKLSIGEIHIHNALSSIV